MQGFWPGRDNPGITQPLTVCEVDEAFAQAPHKTEQHACWEDSDGKPHRDGDLPAMVWKDGEQHWYKNGKIHRDGLLPAIIRPDGTMRWFEHGKFTGDQDFPPPNAGFPGQQTKSASKK